MDRNVAKYLVDIKLAIEEVEYFVSQRPRKYSAFLGDLMYRKAVEREIGIIGEALNQALKLQPDLPITDAKKIVGTRNYVVHAYDSLRPDMRWAIVINELPILKLEVNKLLPDAS